MKTQPHNHTQIDQHDYSKQHTNSGRCINGIVHLKILRLNISCTRLKKSALKELVRKNIDV
eukprot:snap_masked-scaffold_6-processed-gene-2.17-mRNA-1 protein AED:1.00 eAED:1.00 QI:0/0/0/0/1/1/4/0/60